MAKIRRRGRLHNTHISIPEKEYQIIKGVCEKLDITLADYFNQVIHKNGYEKLQILAKRINKEPRPCKLEMEAGVEKEIGDLTEALNGQTAQIRKIGVNLSVLIRDIRSGKVNCGNSGTLALLERMNNDITNAMHENQKIGSRLVDILYDEKSISKVEIIKRSIWDEI